MKIYGNTKTNLELSEKASAMYAQCDPLTITEHDDGSYSISGIEDRDNMTAAEVNEWLEELADDCEKEEARKMTYKTALELNESKGLDLESLTNDSLMALIDEIPGWDYPLAEDCMEELAKRAGIDKAKFFEGNRDYSDLWTACADKLGIDY
jgi:hypothetical protein